MADAQRWVDAYVAAWRSNDPADISGLFTADATYAHSPWKPPLVGCDAIVADWLAEADPPGSWEAAYAAAYVCGDTAIVKGETTYHSEGHRYANLFEIRFVDERCGALVEWHMRMPQSS
jgi:hypothetical protein